MFDFSDGIFSLLIKDIVGLRAYLMSFIARFGFLVLSLLVIFAFFEVRYNTLRRRDKGSVSVNSRPIESLRA